MSVLFWHDLIYYKHWHWQNVGWVVTRSRMQCLIVLRSQKKTRRASRVPTQPDTEGLDWRVVFWSCTPTIAVGPICVSHLLNYCCSISRDHMRQFWSWDDTAKVIFYEKASTLMLNTSWFRRSTALLVIIFIQCLLRGNVSCAIKINKNHINIFLY